MSIVRRTFTHPSSSGTGEIFSRVWVGEDPKYIIQIAHGKCEHSGRYDHFAEFLTRHGFVVYANDHLGHGQTGVLHGSLGYFADKNGWEYIVSDMKSLTDIAKREYPGLPVYLFGHSMGSFLSRSYIARYGKELSGCILCGTMGPSPAARVGKLIANAQCLIQGPKASGALLTQLTTGKNDDEINKPDDGSSWLSTDPAVTKAFSEDPLCGFEFTASAFRDMFTGIAEISTKAWAKRVPMNLPVFLIAGEDDPVAGYGKAPREVTDMLKSAGVRDVEYKTYPGMRHELLNEIHKELPFGDIMNWLVRHEPR